MQRELTERGEDRKTQLLEAAAALFEDRGYAETRISDIAATAGVAKGLLYWYFPSKDALLAELVDEVQNRLRHLQGDALEGIDDPLERVYVGTFVTVRYVAENFHLYGVIARATAGQADSPVARTLATHASDTTAVLEEGQRRKVVRLQHQCDRERAGAVPRSRIAAGLDRRHRRPGRPQRRPPRRHRRGDRGQGHQTAGCPTHGVT